MRTVVVVTSDNGQAKGSVYEYGVRTLLHVRYPDGGIRAGTTVHDLEEIHSLELEEPCGWVVVPLGKALEKAKEAKESRAMIPWNDGKSKLQSGSVYPTNLRIVMPIADANFMHNVTEVMNDLTTACFSADAGSNVNTIRMNLQTEYTKRMVWVTTL